MRSASIRPVVARVTPRHSFQAIVFTDRRLVTWVLALLFGLAGTGVAHAQGGWSGVVADVTGAEGSAVHPAGAAADPAGNVTTVWAAREPDVVKASHYSATTGLWSNPVDLALNTRLSLFPVMAGDAQGNVVAAWITSARPNRLEVARYSAATGAWTPKQTLAQATQTFADLTDVAISGNASGDVLVVWARVGVIEAARYASATGTWDAPVPTSTGTGNVRPLSAVDGAGNGIVTWCAGGVTRAVRYTAATGTWGGAATVATACALDMKLRADVAGNAILVWTAVQGTTNIIAGARYSSNTGSWGETVPLSPAGQHCNRADLDVDAFGNFMVVWEFQAGSLRGIYSRPYVAASAAWGDAAAVVSNPFVHASPRVTGDAGGNFTAAWVVAEAPTGGGLVLAARRPAGGTWSAPVIITRRGDGFQGASLPKLAPDPAGNVMLLWSHFYSPAVGAQLTSSRWLAQLPTGPPGAPLNLFVSPASNRLSIYWGPPTVGGAPTSYTLLARLTPGGPVFASAPVGLATSLEVTAPNGTFVLSVRAANANGIGPESSSVTVTIGSATPPPGPPSNLSANVAGTTVTFTWSPPTSGGSAQRYMLEAGSTPGFTVPLATVQLGSSATFVVPGVPAGTFFVRVLAQNAGGTSGPSNETSFTVAAPPPPVPPVVQSPVVNGSTVQLAWSGPAGATYTLLARAVPNGPVVVSAPVGGLTTLTVPNVASGTYHVSAIATVAGQTSAESNQVVVVVP